jgi:hypothetical protein
VQEFRFEVEERECLVFADEVQVVFLGAAQGVVEQVRWSVFA